MRYYIYIDKDLINARVIKVYEIDDQDRINLITKELDDIRKAEKEEREKAKSEKDNKDE